MLKDNYVQKSKLSWMYKENQISIYYSLDNQRHLNSKETENKPCFYWLNVLYLLTKSAF